MIPKERGNKEAYHEKSHRSDKSTDCGQPPIGLAERLYCGCWYIDGILSVDSVKPYLIYIAPSVTIRHLVDNDRIAIMIDKHTVVQQNAVHLSEGVRPHDILRVILRHVDILRLASRQGKHCQPDNQQSNRPVPNPVIVPLYHIFIFKCLDISWLVRDIPSLTPSHSCRR